jgi:hypothetical protein|tara:strand:+ start:3935 stop:5080 length:1146 start_codon:yes stop_codon:yes gene_type:complete
MKKRVKLEINCKTANIDSNGRLTGDAFTWNFMDGMHIYSSDSWEVRTEDMHKLGVPGLVNSVNLQDKKIYRYPRLDLPRQKVDLLKEKFNCKVIRDVNKADIGIVSMKFFDKLVNREWGKSISYVEMYGILAELKNSDLLSDFALAELRDFMSQTDTTYRVNFQYHKDWGSNDAATQKMYEFIEQITQANKKEDNGHDWILPKENYASYDNIVNSNVALIADTDICSIIDEDLAVISNDKYNDTEKMVQSSDIDNRSLALEMLANCNIEKSFDVVSGIYYWHYDWLKATTNWNTVNVKAFRKRMKSYEGGHNVQNIFSFNNYLNALAKDRKLTKFAVDSTREKLHTTFLGNTVGPNADVFKVDLESLYINEELTNKIISDD